MSDSAFLPCKMDGSDRQMNMIDYTDPCAMLQDKKHNNKKKNNKTKKKQDDVASDQRDFSGFKPAKWPQLLFPFSVVWP